MSLRPHRWIFVLALFCGLFPLAIGSASSGKVFNMEEIRRMLAEPQVRLLAVEFYATWCEPCQKAVPKWEELRQKYRSRGLRLVVVSVMSEGSCTNPDWTPDSVVCDYEGQLSAAWSAQKLPQAFLWSWQGNMLVSHGTVEQVEKAVVEYYEDAPRILVDEPVDARGEKIEGEVGTTLFHAVREELKRTAKFDVVATEKELEEIREIRQKSSSAHYSEETQCKLGEELSPNSVLKISDIKSSKGEKVRLELLSLEKGCLVAASSAPVLEGDFEVAAVEAVSKMLRSLHGEVTSPGGGDLKPVAAPAPGGPAASEPAPADGKPVPSGKYGQMVEDDAAYHERLQTSWREVVVIAENEKLSPARRIQVIEAYLKDFPRDNPHQDAAEAMLKDLNRGKEPVDPEWFRTHTEWFAFRAAGGSHGGGGTLAFFTVRWRHFFWSILRLSGAGVGPAFRGEGSYYGVGGTQFGVPIFFDGANRHELRLSTGLYGGISYSERKDLTYSGSTRLDEYALSFGPHVSIEASYVYHVSRHFALETGFEVLIPTLEMNDRGDEWNRDYSHGRPSESLMVFLGFRL